jgi:hypothetical protein
MWKISQNLAKFLGTSLKTRIQQLIPKEELENPGQPFKCLICSFLQAFKWCKSFELEISHFLTVIEFNTKFEEKRVGRSPQEILTRPTNRNVLISLQGTIWRQNGIVPRYSKFFPSICPTTKLRPFFGYRDNGALQISSWLPQNLVFLRNITYISLERSQKNYVKSLSG